MSLFASTAPLSTRVQTSSWRFDVSQRRNSARLRCSHLSGGLYEYEYGFTPLINSGVTGLASIPAIQKIHFTKYAYLMLEHGREDHWRFQLVPLAAEYLATGIRPTDSASRAIEATARDWVSCWDQLEHPDDAVPFVEGLFWTTVDRLRQHWADIDRLVQFAEIGGSLSADDIWELLYPTGFAARRATAMHEAGQVVTAYALGCLPWYVTIAPSSGLYGAMLQQPSCRRHRDARNASRDRCGWSTGR